MKLTAEMIVGNGRAIPLIPPNEEESKGAGVGSVITGMGVGIGPIGAFGRDVGRGMGRLVGRSVRDPRN